MSEQPSIISIRNVTKVFGRDTVAVDDVSFDVRQNEFFALLGPSGCGKTTLLRMLAGFETPSEGAIVIGDQDMVDVPPNRRPVNMVFQSYAVFPHMTVFDNVAYGLRVTGTAKAEIGPRVDEALAMVKLSEFAKRKPDQLSGGQRQRVALARALVKKPKVLLLDEPLSALDAKLREAMRLELVRLQHTIGITFIIVTHDQDEALSMADRIAVMEGGRVQQIAPPSELYEFPANRFVADFIGRINVFEGAAGRFADGALEVAVDGLETVPVPHGEAVSGPVGLAVRPEKVRLSPAEPGAGSFRVRGEVAQIAYYGEESQVFVSCSGDLTIVARVQNDARTTTSSIAVGDPVWISWQPRDTLILRD